MIITKRLSVTLNNGRAHLLRVPDDVDVKAAAEVLCGLRPASDLAWPDGAEEWLPFDEGDGWVRRDSIVEVAVVDFVETPTEIYG